jgi:hypothetical protein
MFWNKVRVDSVFLESPIPVGNAVHWDDDSGDRECPDQGPAGDLRLQFLSTHFFAQINRRELMQADGQGKELSGFPQTYNGNDPTNHHIRKHSPKASPLTS